MHLDTPGDFRKHGFSVMFSEVKPGKVNDPLSGHVPDPEAVRAEFISEHNIVV